jgi:asparaginyl-tRNA synthetase
MYVEKALLLQKRLGIIKGRRTTIPKPIEQLSENEIKRKQCISRVMTHVLTYLTCKLVNDGFEWLLPVVFSKSTDPLWPDQRTSLVKRVEVEIYGKKVRATSSMIVHKLVACSLTYPKLFVLSPNVRIERMERAKSGMHVYEFTQLDFEVRNAASKEVRNLVEKMISGLMRSLEKCMSNELVYLERYNSFKAPETPFRVYDRTELEDEYGTNWEIQLMLELCDPIWVINIPREFYDFEEDKWDNYDLLLPGCGEVLSGGRREWEYRKIIRKMERDNVRREDYEVLLKLAKKGRLKPSAGAGIGIERLVGWMVGTKHVGETQTFPKVPGIVYDL